MNPRTRKMSRKVKTAAVLVVLAALMLTGYLTYLNRRANSREVLLQKSAEQAAEGSYADAVRSIDKALEAPQDQAVTDEMLYLKKAEYLQKAGDNDQALSIAMRVVRDTQEGQEEFDEAWERIAQICTEEEEYGKFATLLEGSGVESVKSRYYNYLVYDPVFRDPPGTYEGGLELVIESQGEGTVFYTIDGSDPTEKSNLYTEPIRLRPGIYTVRTFFVNRYGLKSNTVTGTYQIKDE